MSISSTSKSIEANEHRLGLDASARTYISRQAILFEELLPELLKEYSGQWVLFEENRVIDADLDYQDLLARVKETMGDKIVLIKKVEPTMANS